jgi:murein endopeptidase
VRRAALAVLLVLLAVPGAQAMPVRGPVVAAPLTDAPIAWRESQALGRPYAGRLAHGVRLPAAGRDFWTYDWGLRTSPNRAWRRSGTDGLVRTVLRVVAEHRAAHPGAPRVGIADLSRRHGGGFGAEFGGLGHVSHQNGRDVDVLYPRRDGAERHPGSPRLVDEALAQDLVDRFVRAGASRVYTGPSLRLRGPRRIVQPLAHHDDHLHVRLGAR